MAAPPIMRKKKKKSESLVRKYWWVVPLLGCVGMIGWIATGPRWSRAPNSRPGGKPIAGYVASTQKMTQEYAQFYGKQLNNAGIERAFDQANQSVNAMDYTKALGLLEQVSKVAAVPVVNSLWLISQKPSSELFGSVRRTN